jgi:hypothetical protein
MTLAVATGNLGWIIPERASGTSLPHDGGIAANNRTATGPLWGYAPVVPGKMVNLCQISQIRGPEA